MNIARLDHLVLTVADIARACEFYTRVLGMEVVNFGEGRTALRFGQQKINLHPADNIPGLVADRPTPGSGDLHGQPRGWGRRPACHGCAAPATAHPPRLPLPVAGLPRPSAG